MTLWLMLEKELAESQGIDLPWLECVAPETAMHWREDNQAAVYDMHGAIISRR